MGWVHLLCASRLLCPCECLESSFFGAKPLLSTGLQILEGRYWLSGLPSVGLVPRQHSTMLTKLAYLLFIARPCSGLGMLTFHTHSILPSRSALLDLDLWLLLTLTSQTSHGSGLPLVPAPQLLILNLQASLHDSIPTGLQGVWKSDRIQVLRYQHVDSAASPSAPRTCSEGPPPWLTAAEIMQWKVWLLICYSNIHTVMTFQIKKALHWTGTSSKSNKHLEKKYTHFPHDSNLYRLLRE